MRARRVGRYPIKLQLGRTTASCTHPAPRHCSRPATCSARGEIPADVQRLIFRPSTASRRAAPRTQAGRPVHGRTVLALLTIDGHPIQSNYLARYFSEFFADRARTRLFWSMASADRLAERRAALEQDAVYKSLTPENRELLARIVKRDLTDDEIEQEMRQLVELLGRDKVVFVTHVNAMTPDNVPIEQREQLIAAVVASSQRIGVPCDPTPLMNKLGQAEAMEDGGLDLTHYTPLFAERLYTDWYKTFMRPRMSASAPQPAASAGRRRQRRAHREALGRRRAARGLAPPARRTAPPSRPARPYAAVRAHPGRAGRLRRLAGAAGRRRRRWRAAGSRS